MSNQNGDCQFFSWEEKNWPAINPSKIQVGNWLFYLSDMYFGQVKSHNSQTIQIQVTNFRVDDAKYTLDLPSTKWQTLRQKPGNVLVDPDIPSNYPALHKSLKKSFQIWRKLDTLVLEAKQKHPFPECVPSPFLEMGKSFGKWAASGYMWQDELEKLQRNGFMQTIKEWRPLREISEDEEFPEALLEVCDNIASLSLEEAKNKKIKIADYLTIRGGYFVDNPENRKKFDNLAI